MTRYALLVLTTSLLVHPTKMLAQQDLEIGMKLTKTAVMLGEPVWVDVTVSNISGHPIAFDFASACFGNKPVKVHIPAAESAVMEPRRCFRGTAGSCPTGATPSLLPGESLTRRYLVDGEFHIAHHGSYEVQLETTISYALVSPSAFGSINANLLKQQQAAKQTVVITVNAADSGKLLALEQAWAASVSAARPPVPQDRKSLDAETTRLASWRRSELQLEQLILRDETVKGLAEFPVAGMEPVFRGWVDVQQYNSYGVQALKRLNTAAARNTLAQLVESQDRPKDTWFQGSRQEAVEALGELRDRSYLLLLKRLVRDGNPSLRAAAIEALGMLGGEQELPLLADLVHNGATANDRQMAIRAIGDTDSLKAVPLLLEFADLPDAGEPFESYMNLKIVTHLEFVRPDSRPLPELESAWQEFWDLHRANARAYGPFECKDEPVATAANH